MKKDVPDDESEQELSKLTPTAIVNKAKLCQLQIC
jgi:hypothetical protein